MDRKKLKEGRKKGKKMGMEGGRKKIRKIVMQLKTVMEETQRGGGG